MGSSAAALPQREQAVSFEKVSRDHLSTRTWFRIWRDGLPRSTRRSAFGTRLIGFSTKCGARSARCCQNLSPPALILGRRSGISRFRADRALFTNPLSTLLTHPTVANQIDAETPRFGVLQLTLCTGRSCSEPGAVFRRADRHESAAPCVASGERSCVLQGIARIIWILGLGARRSDGRWFSDGWGHRESRQKDSH